MELELIAFGEISIFVLVLRMLSITRAAANRRRQARKKFLLPLDTVRNEIYQNCRDFRRRAVFRVS
jgi:hypothetical protein